MLLTCFEGVICAAIVCEILVCEDNGKANKAKTQVDYVLWWIERGKGVVDAVVMGWASPGMG